MEVYTSSQIRMFTNVKMLLLPNLIHGFLELPMRIVLGVSVNIDKLTFKTLYGNAKG